MYYYLPDKRNTEEYCQNAPERTHVASSTFKPDKSDEDLSSRIVIQRTGGNRCENPTDRFTTLRRRENITKVKPEFVRALRTDVHEKLDNGTVIKSIAEDETISLSCEAGGAKPIPTVQWWNGTSQIKAHRFVTTPFKRIRA
ncbi:unnamed protein product [Nezara viridula]|uniref:Ig-like domain-containing protein n=1 Tax=Nezara viridula TaxID=85310 RepID=A0A9P0H604_NEZVI|nr:unnamed protein product [Nezara viridula]